MMLFATVVGVDYIASPKLVSFQIGAKPGDRQNVSIAVPLTDNIVENTESFQLHLTSISSGAAVSNTCLLYTSPSPRDATLSRMPSSA